MQSTALSQPSAGNHEIEADLVVDALTGYPVNERILCRIMTIRGFVVSIFPCRYDTSVSQEQLGFEYPYENIRCHNVASNVLITLYSSSGFSFRITKERRPEASLYWRLHIGNNDRMNKVGR